MAHVQRGRSDQTSRRTMAALIAGVVFGLMVAMVRMSRNSGPSAMEIMKGQAEGLKQQVVDLETKLKEAKHERDTARRQLADAEQQQKVVEERAGKQLEELQAQLNDAKHQDSKAVDTAQHVADLTTQLKEARRDRQLVQRQAQALEQKVASLQAAGGSAAAGAGAGATLAGSKAAAAVIPDPASCIDRHAAWGPCAERDAKNPDLAAILRKVAVNNEVLVAVSNKNYAWPGGMLELWMKGVQRAGVTNALVVALDDETKTNVEKFGLSAFRIDMAIPESQKNSGSNHAVSALKFRLLKPFLELGYSVLLSDVDILVLQNPFEHLVKDSDVESLSDGWDDGTAYGYNDVADDASMGWARYAHSMRIFVFNSGLFYLRPTCAAIALLDKVIHRVETENGWDQALFNECIFFPNSPRNKDPSVTRRVMDYTKFLNSKFLFKFLRHDKPRFNSLVPVMLHVNYHPDKFERMKALWKVYVEGERTAIDRFPDGSEKKRRTMKLI